MTRKDYQLLAQSIGTSFAMAGEENRTLIYDAVYTPLVAALAADNENFDQLRFSHACAVAQGKAEVDTFAPPATRPDWIYGGLNKA